MKRLGIVGRADHGGIAAQSLAVAQHLHPHAALVLDMTPGDRGRGPFDLKPWFDAMPDGGIVTYAFPFADVAVDWLIDQSDVIFAVEGPPPGRDDFPERCAAAGVELVIHANPELYRHFYRGPTTRITLPTTWHQDRFPDATVLPMPVDRVKFPFRCRTRARTFLHVAAPAFHDRNGTALVMEALQYVREPVTMILHGVPGFNACEDQVGLVHLVYRPACSDNRDVYPDDADVLVLPRRYGGQALTCNEAASLGIPCLTLGLSPLMGRPGVVTVPAVTPYVAGMIGGDEQVWACDPMTLAAEIDRLADSPEWVATLSLAADAWAERNSWPTLLPTWRKVLGLA